MSTVWVLWPEKGTCCKGRLLPKFTAFVLIYTAGSVSHITFAKMPKLTTANATPLATESTVNIQVNIQVEMRTAGVLLFLYGQLHSQQFASPYHSTIFARPLLLIMSIHFFLRRFPCLGVLHTCCLHMHKTSIVWRHTYQHRMATSEVNWFEPRACSHSCALMDAAISMLFTLSVLSVVISNVMGTYFSWILGNM